MFNKAALKRVGLSALKAFAAVSIPLLIAGISGVHTLSDAKALGLAVLAAGGDAAFKVIQISLED